MPVFTRDNCPRGAVVYDVERREALRSVVRVDTDAARVWVHDSPPVVKDGEALQTPIDFDEVVPVYDGFEDAPAMFHCQGRRL